jgi:hypothetical protein
LATFYFTTEVTIDSILTNLYDVSYNSVIGKAVVGVQKTASTVDIYTIDSTLTVTKVSTCERGNTATFFALECDSDQGYTYLVLNEPSTGLRFAAYAPNWAILANFVSIDSYLTDGVNAIILPSATSGNVKIIATRRNFQTPTNNTTPYAYLQSYVITSLAYASQAILYRGVSLASKAVRSPDSSFSYFTVALDYAYSTLFVGASFFRTYQPKYFILGTTQNIVDKAVIARIFDGKGGKASEIAATNFLPRPVYDVNATTFYFPALSTSELNATQSSWTNTFIAYATMTLTDPIYSYSTVEKGELLLFSGGFAQMYDGKTVCELGFHVYPEHLLSAINNPNDDGLGNLTFGYYACYKWIDRWGQIHRSGISENLQVITIGNITATNNYPTITVPTLRVQSVYRKNVTIELYRTIANGMIWYKTAEKDNDSTVDSVSFNDKTTDAVLMGLEQLYTTGGVLENIAAGPCTSLCVHRGRVFYIDSTNPSIIYYSHKLIPGTPVQFSDALYMVVEPQTGDCTALASIDEKLVIFKEYRAYYVTGDGPDMSGNQSDFSDPMPIPTGGVGCVNQRAVCEIPTGLMFQSDKGIYLLDRAGGLQYISAPVEPLIKNAWIGNNVPYTNALIPSHKHQVRFTIEDPFTWLVYDYLLNQWEEFQGSIDSVDAVVYNDAHTFLTTAGDIYSEDLSAYTDENFTTVIETGWIRMQSMQGFQRVRRAMLEGVWYSAHNLLIEIMYDYNDTVVQTISQDAMTEVIPYSFRIDFKRQKCKALKLRITVQKAASGSVGQYAGFSGMTFEVGIKKGTDKVPVGRSLK